MRSSVSVIIPCYNAGSYILEAVESVLRQQGNFYLIEILIVDDRSDDENTKTVLKKLANADKVHVLENTGQRGPGAARNTGIDHATGDWIAFLDADDVWTEDSINVRLAASKRFPQCGWIGGDFLIWHGDDLFEAESFFRSRPIPRELLCDAFRKEQPILLKRPVREFLLSGLTNTCASLIKKDFLTKISGFDPTLRMQQDYHLFLRLANVSDFAFVPIVVTHQRQHASNLTKIDTHVFEWRLEALKKLLKDSEFTLYSKEIRRKISSISIGLSYRYRQQRRYLNAWQTGAQAVRAAPHELKAWKTLATSLFASRG